MKCIDVVLILVVWCCAIQKFEQPAVPHDVGPKRLIGSLHNAVICSLLASQNLQVRITCDEVILDLVVHCFRGHILDEIVDGLTCTKQQHLVERPSCLNTQGVYLLQPGVTFGWLGTIKNFYLFKLFVHSRILIFLGLCINSHLCGLL